MLNTEKWFKISDVEGNIIAITYRCVSDSFLLATIQMHGCQSFPKKGSDSFNFIIR